MKGILSKIADAPYAVAAAAAVALLPSQASAQASTFGQAANDVRDQLGDVGRLVVGGGFLAGIVMIAAGLMKLKQASEDGGQRVKYGEGLWRLAVGAGLVAIPAVTGMLSQSLGLGGTPNISEAQGF